MNLVGFRIGTPRTELARYTLPLPLWVSFRPPSGLPRRAAVGLLELIPYLKNRRSELSR